MSRRGSHVPKKLKHDAIVEAVVELRFETPTKPEFLMVRLNEMPEWKTYTEARLPAYAIPETIREVDPTFRVQPIFELVKDQRSLRVGPRVLSYHLRQPYRGWAIFGKEIERVVEAIFQKTDRLLVKRLGLRYVNALSSEAHGICSAGDLDVAVRMGGDSVTDGININTMMQVSKDTVCTVKVATPSFVSGSLPPNTTVLADIDVFTPDSFETRDEKVVKDWIEAAHETEKREFFVLLKDETIAALEEN